jgi:hypothetical protein
MSLAGSSMDAMEAAEDADIHSVLSPEARAGGSSRGGSCAFEVGLKRGQHRGRRVFG